MNKNIETFNETQNPKLGISDVRQRFIGKYCYERYRYRKTKDGKIIKQGMGLKGVIKAIKRHKFTKELIAEFDITSTYCHCQLEWVTTDETLKDMIIPLNVA
jgi:hypothetical protein